MTFQVPSSSPTPSLTNMITKVRKYSASPDIYQVSQQEIIDAINTFYLWRLPSNLKLLSLQRSVVFYTQPNINVYPFDTVAYFDVQPPVYIGGYEMQYVQDKQSFYLVWPKVKNKITFATGDGTTGAYTATISGTPILRSYGSTYADGNQEREIIVSAIDDSNESMTLYDIPLNATSGTFAPIGSETPIAGTSINYITGAISVTFPNNVLAGSNINIQYTPYVASRPQTIWFFQNQFTLFPVPDDSYEIVFNAIIRPTAFLEGDLSAEPLIQEWWELLAMGAARIILQERLDAGNLQVLDKFYYEMLAEVERRTLTQLGNQRVPTIFSSPPGQYLDIYNPVGGGT